MTDQQHPGGLDCFSDSAGASADQLSKSFVLDRYAVQMHKMTMVRVF